jgi:threonine/homoserine/homoserine lactone efflux protein
MKDMEGKIAGWVIIIVGVLYAVSGRAGFTYYGYSEGWGARIAGILMIVIGVSFAYPRKKS